MTFMGSKTKYKKDIPPIINKYIKDNNIETFIDCTCGGANLTDKIICRNVYGIDLSPSLIALHKQAQNDFSKIPIDGCREMWDNSYAAWKKMKKILDIKSYDQFNSNDFINIGMSLYEIGCMEWYASFSNGGFPRGYAKNSATRNYYQEAWRNHKKQSEQENYKKIKFFCDDYQHFINKYIDETGNIKTLLYFDPPYKNTKPYAISKNFDYENFYEYLKETSKIFPICVSEQYLPEEFNKYKIWEKEVKRTAGKDNNFKAKETLWFIDRREEHE